MACGIFPHASRNNFTDSLCKDGEITLTQYESWIHPEVCQWVKFNTRLKKTANNEAERHLASEAKHKASEKLDTKFVLGAVFLFPAIVWIISRFIQ